MMKTGQYAELHEKTGRAYPVTQFRHACMHDNLDEITKWLDMHPDNKDIAEIWYFNTNLEKL